MPRRPAAQRHADLPAPPTWPPTDEAALIEAIVAIHHPTRRRLLEALAEGPQSVGSLARAAGIAVGSASHHLRMLAKAGWIAPAPELAPDTRSSWWRARHRTLTWTPDRFVEGTIGHRTAEASQHLFVRGIIADLVAGLQPSRDTTISDTFARATSAEVAELDARLNTVVEQWRSRLEPAPDARRVRIVTLAIDREDRR